MEEYLIKEFGNIEGSSLYECMKVELQLLINETKNKSASQMRILRNIILPKVALYQLLCEKMEAVEALEILRKYMCEVVGVAMHIKHSKMEKIPFFYVIYSKIFISYTKKSDAWKSKISEQDKNHFALDIHKCLWYDACVENGCPELCQCFCQCDDITYSKLKKIGFSRTQTLALGGTMCDFKFYKK